MRQRSRWACLENQRIARSLEKVSHIVTCDYYTTTCGILRDALVTSVKLNYSAFKNTSFSVLNKFMPKFRITTRNIYIFLIFGHANQHIPSTDTAAFPVATI